MKVPNHGRFGFAVVFCYLLACTTSAQSQPGLAAPTDSLLYCPSPVHLDNDNGTFSTPLYPQKYPSGEHCVWEILVDRSKVVQLKFHTFDLESDDLCGFDRVTVHEGTGASHRHLGTFCGSDVPPLLKSSENSLAVSFRSNSVETYGGFLAEYTDFLCRVFHKLLFLTSPKIRNKKTSRHSGSFARIFSKLGSNDNLNMNSPDVIEVPDFDPDVFRDLMEYIHTGCVKLQPRTLIGLMNAAEFYGLEELRRACIGFLHCCISLDTVCPLLGSMEKYVHFKSTRSLMQKVLEFVDDHATDVLTQAPFAILPDHVVRLVLSRDVLQADEVTKFHAALRWARRYSDKHPDISVKAAISPLLDYIDFNSMSAMTLMKDIRATGTVPDEKLVTALAYQADPASVESMRMRNAARSPRRKRNNVTSQMATLSMSTDRLDDDVNSDVGESDSGNSSNDHDDGSLHYF